MSESANNNPMIIDNASAIGYGSNPRVANLALGSTLGPGVRSVSLDAATPLVLPPATIVVLHTPTMYDNNPAIGQMIKVLLETQATAVDGIDIEYTLDTSDSPIGHDGQSIKVPTQTKRSEVSPTFTIPEVTGNLVWDLFTKWITDIQDADTIASMTHLDNPTIPFVSSTYSISMAVIQFDPSGNPDNIVGGGFISNMFPTTAGPFGLERQIGQSSTKERSIPFTGYLRHNKSTRAALVDIAKQLNLGSWALRSGAARQPGLSVDQISQYLTDSELSKAIESMPQPVA